MCVEPNHDFQLFTPKPNKSLRVRNDAQSEKVSSPRPFSRVNEISRLCQPIDKAKNKPSIPLLLSLITKSFSSRFAKPIASIPCDRLIGWH